MNQSIRYFALVGYFTAFLMTAVFIGANLFLNTVSSVILMVMASIFFTGAFHEDGLIDLFDGFGGGQSRDQILNIMKDSRIGSYGAIAVILSFGLKVSLLYEIIVILKNKYNAKDLYFQLLLVFIVAQSLSRWMASTFTYSHSYAGEAKKSKHPFLSKKTKLFNLAPGFIFSLAPFYFFANFIYLTLPLALLFFWLYLSFLFKKKIGGYTGDCLGAAQQIFEIVIYIAFIVLWKFI